MKKQITIEPHELKEFIIASMRYYLPRMTISAASFPDTIEKYWDELHSSVQKLIQDEIKEQIKQAEERQNKMWLNTDKRYWEKVLIFKIKNN